MVRQGNVLLLTLSSIGGKSQVHGSSCGEAQVQDSSRGGQSQILVRWWNEDKLDTELAENDIVAGLPLGQPFSWFSANNCCQFSWWSLNIIVGRAIIKEHDNTITKVDINVIDDDIVGIVHKDNEEIEGKLADNYIVVGGTITKENVIDDSKVEIVHEDDEENLDKLDTELRDNSIPVNRTIITKVDANVNDYNILGIGHENNEGNEDELDRELADNYRFVDKIIIKADANAIDDNIVGNGHEDD